MRTDTNGSRSTDAGAFRYEPPMVQAAVTQKNHRYGSGDEAKSNFNVSSNRNGAPARAGQAMAYPGGKHQFVSALGIFLTDVVGDQYLDAESGTFNVPLGYGHPMVINAVESVLKSGLTHVSSSFSNEHVEAAADALIEVAPGNITRCHMKGSTGGSEANEQALRACSVATGKNSVMAFRGGHHGQTVLTTQLSGMAFRRERLPAANTLPVIQADPPDCYRCPYGKQPAHCRFECIEPIERALDNAPTGQDDVMAFVAEPILGAGGGITPPNLYWSELHGRLQARGIPLVFDEVQTFGRTGHIFAADFYGVEPEIITLAKGISGSGIPAAGAVLMEDQYAVLNSGERSLTWGASPITCSAVAATIAVMREPIFMDRVKESSIVLADRLKEIEAKYDCVGTVRGVGLMTGIEIVRSTSSREPDAELANRIVEHAMDEHLLLRTSLYGRGGFVKVRPPLVIGCDEVEELVERLDRSISSALQ